MKTSEPYRKADEFQKIISLGKKLPNPVMRD